MEKPIGDIIIEWIPFLIFFSIIPFTYYISSRYGKVGKLLSITSYAAILLLGGFVLSGLLIVLGVRPVIIAIGAAYIITVLVLLPLHRRLLNTYSTRCLEPKDFPWKDIFHQNLISSLKNRSRSAHLVIGVSIFALLLTGLFYWYEYRPSSIRKLCVNQSYEEAHYIAMQTRGRQLTKKQIDEGWYYYDDYDFVYRQCLSRNGLKAN